MGPKTAHLHKIILKHYCNHVLIQKLNTVDNKTMGGFTTMSQINIHFLVQLLLFKRIFQMKENQKSTQRIQALIHFMRNILFFYLVHIYDFCMPIANAVLRYNCSGKMDGNKSFSDKKKVENLILFR